MAQEKCVGQGLGMTHDIQNNGDLLCQDEVRPADLRQGQLQAYHRDIERLKLVTNQFVHVPCPACGADEPRYAFSKYTFEFQRCGECRMLYMSPRPTPDIMSDYYSNSENYKYWAEYIFPASESARREKLHRPMLEWVIDQCLANGVNGGTLLEIGPGFGTFSELALNAGFFERVIAIERTPEMAKACRARGVTIVEKPVEDVTRDEIGGVDVVVSFEVIEHLFDPQDFLVGAGKLLNPGGLFILSCPNGEGFDVEILGANSSAVDSEHVNLFTPASLSLLLERNGFIPLNVMTPGRLDAELVRDAVQEGVCDLTDQPFLQRVLIDEWERLGGPFQSFLAANKLSSHMRLIARKSG